MIREIVTGFATTFKHIFRKPITVNYPDEKVPMFPKFRGKQVLMRDENGLEKCVACGLHLGQDRHARAGTGGGQDSRGPL